MKDRFARIMGDNIRLERLRRKYTQDKLAELLDMSINYVGKLERGVIIPSAYVIYKLSKILNINIMEFYRDIDN
ncbi:helix-turn-helix transcriptional regulator [bacterium]|nr:helix-turn-helix transcriptional regulator [bacterium]